MERDKIIAIVLVVGLVFLFIALIGVITVTGFVLLFVTNPADVPAENTPILEGTGTATNPSGENPGTIPDTSGTPSGPVSPPQEEEEEPVQEEAVCGNGELEDGEVCDGNEGCSGTQVCVNSCSLCQEPESPAEELTDLVLTSLTFWCAQDFNGEDGLAVKIFKFKNNASTDFTYTDNITLSAVTGEVTDSVITNNAFDFEAKKSGGTEDIYNTNLTRTSAPFLFLGNIPGKTTITVEFGDDYILTYEYTLKGQDFANASCQ